MNSSAATAWLGASIKSRGGRAVKHPTRSSIGCACSSPTMVLDDDEVHAVQDIVSFAMFAQRGSDEIMWSGRFKGSKRQALAAANDAGASQA